MGLYGFPAANFVGVFFIDKPVGKVLDFFWIILSWVLSLHLPYFKNKSRKSVPNAVLSGHSGKDLPDGENSHHEFEPGIKIQNSGWRFSWGQSVLRAEYGVVLHRRMHIEF